MSGTGRRTGSLRPSGGQGKTDSAGDRRFAVYSDFLNATRSWIEAFDDYQDRIAEDWLLDAVPEYTEVANAADEALSGLELLSSPATRQAAEATRTAILKIAAAATLERPRRVRPPGRPQ